MSQDNRQFHFRPANYSYRPTADEGDKKPDTSATKGSDPTPPASGSSPTGQPGTEPDIVPAEPFSQMPAPEPVATPPEPLNPPVVAPVADDSAASAAPQLVTPPAAPMFDTPKPTEPGREDIAPIPAGSQFPSSPELAAHHSPLGANDGQEGSAHGTAQTAAPGAVAAGAGTGALGSAVAAPAEGGTVRGADSGDGGNSGESASSGGGAGGGGHVLPRLAMILAGVLLLVLGLIIGAFGLGSPTVRTTPGPTQSVTETVTPPPVTVTAPPVTVTATPTMSQTTVSIQPSATNTYTSSATNTYTSQATSGTVGTAVQGTSCPAFQATGTSPDGTPMYCTRTTVNDPLLWRPA